MLVLILPFAAVVVLNLDHGSDNERVDLSSVNKISAEVLICSARSGMDGNKDEAARCVEIARAALASGDKQRALKFIGIAKRLDHTAPVDVLLSACERLDSPQPTSGASEAGSDRVRKDPASSNASQPYNGDRSYTEDSIKLIREIKKQKDYYAILGVEKSCSVEEVRRSYKKLSLKVHPDKNKAPGAEEAFKTVCKAFKCLSDGESRRQYDQTGSVEEHELNQQHNNVPRRRRRAAGNDIFEDNFDPDEIFRSFFGSEALRTHMARGTGGLRREHNVNIRGGDFNLILLAQILIIFLFFLFAYLPFSEPSYSLQKTYAYQIPKVTEKYEVEFFVRSEEFDQKYPEGSPVREKLENDVLGDYKGLLSRYCHMELQRRHWARNYPTPHCDKLRKLTVA